MRKRQRNLFFRGVGRQNIDEALSCLHGADYHLRTIVRLEQVHGLTTQNQKNALHYHVRAFFWELYAVVDCIDHVHALPDFVAAWAKQVRAQQWFLEIDAYRNLAHRMFHLIEVVYPAVGGKCKFFMIQQALPQQAGMVGSSQLIGYRDEIARALDELTAPETKERKKEGD